MPPRAYVAGTYDGKTLRLYVNGRQVAAKVFSGTPDANRNPVEIGAYAGQAVWHGTIDEVAIYRRALSPKDVARRYELGLGEANGSYPELIKSTPGLLAYYRLDDAKGGQARSSGTGPTGAYEQPVKLGATGLITHDPDKAISLNGKQGSVSIPSTRPLDLGRDYTIEAWVTDAGAGNRHIIAKVDSYFLKTDLFGKWATGFYSKGQTNTIESRASAIPASASTPAPNAAPKKKGGGSSALVPIVLVLAAVLAVAAAMSRTRRRDSELAAAGAQRTGDDGPDEGDQRAGS